MLSIAVAFTFGQMTISTQGGLSAVRNRFFNAVIDRYYDDYDRQTIQPDSIERAGQGHILFLAGRANRMLFFEHIDIPSFGEPGWPRFRIKAYELVNGRVHALGVWKLSVGKTKITKADGTIARFIAKDQPQCELPADRIPKLKGFFDDRNPWACYSIHKMHGNLTTFINPSGDETDDFEVTDDFGMTRQEKRYLKSRSR